MWNRGQLQGERLPTGTIIIFEDDRSCGENKVAIYGRVSSSENKSNLETQAKRLEAYCIAKGYQIVRVVKEVGSGVNDHRKLLLKRQFKNETHQPQELTKQSEQLEHLPLDVKSDCPVILNKHCLLRITGGTLEFSA